jgi:hypothetical protein
LKSKQSNAPENDDWVEGREEEEEAEDPPWQAEGSAQRRLPGDAADVEGEVIQGQVGSQELSINALDASAAQYSSSQLLPPGTGNDLEIEKVISTFSTHAQKVTGSSAKGKERAHSDRNPTSSMRPPASVASSASRISSTGLTPIHPPASAVSSSSHISSTGGLTSSSSRKRPRDTIERASDILGDKNDRLVNVIREGFNNQDENKRLKYNTILTARELKAREARDQREHDLRLMMSQQTHEESIAAREMKKLELQKEIEEMKLQRARLTTMAALRSTQGQGSGLEPEMQADLGDELEDALKGAG